MEDGLEKLVSEWSVAKVKMEKLFESMLEDDLLANKALQDLLKYSLIIVSSVPILVAYPFAKKFFLKGVMIGALKG